MKYFTSRAAFTLCALQAMLSFMFITSRAQQVDSQSQGWQNVNLGQSFYGGVSFSDPAHGWVAGDSNLFKTSDAGLHWVPIGLPRVGDHYFAKPYFVDTLLGLAFGGDYLPIITTDGGLTWRETNTGSHLPNGFLALNRDTLFVTATGSISRSSDRGSTWIDNELAGPDAGLTPFTGLAKLDSLNLIAVGYNAPRRRPRPPFDTYEVPMIYWSMNAGVYWTRDSTFDPDPGRPSTIAFSAVVGLDSTSAIAFSNGDAFRTTNRGKYWQDIPMHATSVICASFIDSKTGLTGGSGGAIVRTDDGGLTWTEQQSGVPASDNIYSIQMLDSATAFAVAQNGLFVHTTDGGQSWVRNSSASDTLSIQTYPQPGNTTVTFTYHLSEAQHVSLHVYDIRGNIVRQSMSSTYQPAGDTAYTIDTSGLDSGTYLYVFQSEEHLVSGNLSIIH